MKCRLLHRLNSTLILVCVGVLFGASSAWAHDAEHVDYYGYHPIPEAYDGGFCESEELHHHEYLPVELELYNVVEGVYYFIGDPSVYGYEEALVWYYYHHPVPLYWGAGYCYIVGPHRHWWRPWGSHFHLVNGHYHYRGPWGSHYHKHHHVTLPRSKPYWNKKKKEQQDNAKADAPTRAAPTPAARKPTRWHPRSFKKVRPTSRRNFRAFKRKHPSAKRREDNRKRTEAPQRPVYDSKKATKRIRRRIFRRNRARVPRSKKQNKER